MTNNFKYLLIRIQKSEYNLHLNNQIIYNNLWQFPLSAEDVNIIELSFTMIYIKYFI